jgi:hypothetical protein
VYAEVTFRVANERCGDLDMHLAWVESAEENAAIVNVAEQIGDALERLWLGGADRTEGDWRWIDAEENASDKFWSGGLPEAGGKPVRDRYVNWGEGRPNDAANSEAEDCLNLSLNRSGQENGSWNDDDCSSRWGFVCEAD